jgi:hypothetical protein
MSHVRVAVWPASGTLKKAPPEAWTLTSENVTNNALASLKGESLMSTLNVAAIFGGAEGSIDDGPVTVLLSAHATDRENNAASIADRVMRM